MVTSYSNVFTHYTKTCKSCIGMRKNKRNSDNANTSALVIGDINSYIITILTK